MVCGGNSVTDMCINKFLTVAATANKSVTTQISNFFHQHTMGAAHCYANSSNKEQNPES